MGVYYMRRRIQVEAEKPQFCVTTGITFAQADAWFGNTVQDLKLDLIYPRDNTRKYPCVVWICGGAWIQMDRSAHLAYLSVLAQQGFVVASVEYRTSGYRRGSCEPCKRTLQQDKRRRAGARSQYARCPLYRRGR